MDPTKKFWLGWVVSSLVLAAPAGMAADLLEIYRLAKVQDATIRATRAAMHVGLERLPQARSQLFPSVSASVTRNQNDLSNTQPNILGKSQTTNSEYRSGNDTISVRQPLYRPGVWRHYEQAQRQVDEVRANYTQEEQNLAVRVAEAYMNVLFAMEQLSAVVAQQQTTRAQLDGAKKFLVAGAGTRTDVDDAQSRLDMFYANEIEAREQVDFARRQLQSMLTDPIDEIAMLNPAALELNGLAPSSTLDEWLTKALERSPQIHVLTSQVEQATLEVAKAQSGHLPTLDAIVQWSRSESENVNSVASQYTNRSVGLQLTVPLYSGGQVSSAIRQASFNQERALEALEAGRRDLRLRVQKEFRSVVESVAKIRALEQALRSAQQSVVSSRRSYEGGSRTILDVLNADQQRMLVTRDLAQARFFYVISNLRLRALSGEADEGAVAQVNSYFQPHTPPPAPVRSALP